MATLPNKYCVARDWTNGYAAAIKAESRSLSESDDWLAGWDTGYSQRAIKRELLNKYLVSIGIKPMGIVKTQEQKHVEQIITYAEGKP